MEKTFYQFGALYLRWTDEKGNEWEAVKEQVDFLGKECFEQDPYDFLTENDIKESIQKDFYLDW